jgi:hypothetical protein
MKVARQAAVYKSLRDGALWRLLAAHNAPVVLSLLKNHFQENERRIPQSVLTEHIERDLIDLRVEGWDLSQSAQRYIAEWLSAGYLERYFPAGVQEEEYEISAAAAQAIRFIDSTSDRRTTATESRLSVVIQQLSKLVEETDSNPTTRIARLLQEQQRIDRELTNAQSGNIRVLDDAKAIERIREVILLADDLIGDFRRVRDEFESLNRELREQLLDETGNRGKVLGLLFDGVDVISESEAGKTFAAFWRLLIDPEQSKTFEDSLDALNDRQFFRTLSLDERTFLRRLTRSLLEQGGSVHSVLQSFARSLKNFVQSREYLEQRRVNRLLNEAQQAALALRDIVGVAERLEFELPLSSCRLRSLSQMCLHDPSSSLADASINDAAPAEIDLDTISELVAQSEIDFNTLKSNIRMCLDDHLQVSIADVLHQFPAKQGLGSVIGYMAIGSRYGVIIAEQMQSISWEGSDNEVRAARIPLIFFTRDSANDFE